MTKFLTPLLTVSLIACTSQKAVYYEANGKEPQTASQKDLADNTVYYVFENGSYVQSELDKKPEPAGGKMSFYKAMYAHMQYPAQARERGVKGEVVLTVVINESGRAEDAQVKKGIGYGCDETALNAWKKAAQNGFEPAMKGGKAVKVKYDVPVKFDLP